jgi:hypothetical protein
MRVRKNLRVLVAEYNAALPADRPNTALMKLKAAILALKNPATHPSLLIGRADVAADIANDISMGMLGAGSTLVSRYGVRRGQSVKRAGALVTCLSELFPRSRLGGSSPEPLNTRRLSTFPEPG